MVSFENSDVGPILIVGSGLAALSIALKVAPYPVTILSDQPVGLGGSTPWAQGGIACALGEGDTPEQHAQDTIRAGAGLVNEEAAYKLAKEGQRCIQDLMEWGVPFDHDSNDNLILGLEGGHSRRRIVKIKGDQTGPILMEFLIKKALATSSIRFIDRFKAFELCLNERGAVCGVYAHACVDKAAVMLFQASAVVMCTGGIGHLYAFTTNPPQSCGEGLAMAIRAGAQVSHTEFVQFHPTALWCKKDPAPLLTEAIRGEGGCLVNEKDEHFMYRVHPLGDLAPRDIVARTIAQQLKAGHETFLDVRSLGCSFEKKFPLVHEICQKEGFNPQKDKLPIRPAAHYHMGGINVDFWGHTNLEGFRACGEVAFTGVHGANRLASNSLLEAFVFGKLMGEDLKNNLKQNNLPLSSSVVRPPLLTPPPTPKVPHRLRLLMSDHVGVLRNKKDLSHALHQIEKWMAETPSSNPLLVAKVITQAALARQKSCGTHYREDEEGGVIGED